MRRMLPAMVMAILIHVMALTADTNWLRRPEVIAPRAQMISMQLIERAPYCPPVIQPLAQPPAALPPRPAEPTADTQATEKPAATPTPVAHKPKSSMRKTKPFVRKPSTRTAVPPVPPPVTAATESKFEKVSSQTDASSVQKPTDPPIPHAASTTLDPPVTSPIASTKQTKPLATVVMAKPRYHRNPPPAYPSIARKRGYEGTVILDVFVKSDGSVGKLRIATSSNYIMLDRSAMKAVKRWQFEPGREADDVVAMWVRVPVSFLLQ